MSRKNNNTSQALDMHGLLYRKYAEAVESYVKQPTINNWERKEKAFETYNALIENKRSA